MGFSTLARGLIGQITSRFSIWTNQMNQNLRFLDSRMGGLKVIEQIATTASLPATPANGDSYVITSTKTVETWFSDPGTWQTTQLYIPDIFWDVDQAAFYYYDGSNILPFNSIAPTPSNIVLSPTCGSFSTNSTTPVDATNLIEKITTTGGTVEVSLISDAGGNQSYIAVQNLDPSGINTAGFIYVLRDSVVIAQLPFDMKIDLATTELLLTVPAPGLLICEQGLPSATYEYKIQADVPAAINEIFLNNLKLKIQEII